MKRLGFSDAQLAHLLGDAVTAGDVRAARVAGLADEGIAALIAEAMRSTESEGPS